MLFEYTHSKNNIDFYKATKDVYIESINLETGDIEYKKVTGYSIHKNIPMYEIKDTKDRFKPFFVSGDHSLITYNNDTKQLEKTRPIDIIDSPEKYNIVTKDGFIPAVEIKITYHKNMDAYDLTVEDNYTFCTDDGVFLQDTVAVYMPMTVESQKELREKVHRKVKSTATGTTFLEIRHGMLLGWYRATKTSKKMAIANLPRHLTEENIIEYLKENPSYYNAEIEYSSVKTKFKKIKTTLSRILFNLVIPNNIEYVNKPIDKKVIKTIGKYLSVTMSDDELIKIFDKLEQYGFLLATFVPATMSIDEMIIPESLKKKVDKLKEIKDPVKGMKYLKELEKELIKYVREHYPQIADIFDSGSRGSWNDLTQMVLAKGYVTDPEGKVIKIPVTKGFVDNLNSKEYFTVAPSARYGIVSRAINTNIPGYLTRRLIFAGSDVRLSDSNKCKTQHYLKWYVDDEQTAEALIDRYLKDGTKITYKNYKNFIGKTVELCSPMYCTDKHGICKRCYGDLYKIGETKEIGMLAAQSIGERGTQLIMRAFHTGGVAEISEIPKIVEDCPDLVQEASTIIAKVGGVMIIDKLNSEYVYSEDKIIFKSGIITIEFDDEVGYDIEVTKEDFFSLELYFDDIKVTDDEIKLYFSKNTNIIELDLQSQDMLVEISKVQRLFEVTSQYKNKKAEDILKDIWSIYKKYGIRLVHFEVILSNMMRDKDNPYQPARLSKDPLNYELIGISKVPFYTSPLLAIGFQDITKAVYYGLVNKNDLENREPSVLEKLLLGEM